MFCPGHSKYLLNADEICCRPFGMLRQICLLAKMCTETPSNIDQGFVEFFFEKNRLLDSIPLLSVCQNTFSASCLILVLI